jgi:hypothetical protein
VPRATEALMLSPAAHRRLLIGVDMDDKCVRTEQIQAVKRSIREHLCKAQELMDSIEPDSIFGARIQHLIDDLEEHSSSG